MNVRMVEIFIITLALLAGLGAPAWSQEAASQEAASQEAASQEAASQEAATQEAATQEAATQEAATQEAAIQEVASQEAASQEAASQEAASQEAESQEAAIQVEDAVVCQQIVDREPIGSGDVFAKESDKIYCFSRVVGAAEDTQITHNWYYQGTLKASVKLNVRSPNWRTWSSKAILPELTGEWMVEILSEDGKPMESIIFFLK